MTKNASTHSQTKRRREIIWITADPEFYLDGVRLAMAFYRAGAGRPHDLDIWTCEPTWLARRLGEGGDHAKSLGQWLAEACPERNTVLWCPSLRTDVGVSLLPLAGDTTRIHLGGDSCPPSSLRSEKSVARLVEQFLKCAPHPLPERTEVHMLWAGIAPMGDLERANVHSFVAHGHVVNLWVYSRAGVNLPGLCRVMDANEVVDCGQAFTYRHGIHAGSWAGFSDIFRYKVLLDHGGWWCDTDVTCMGSLDAFRQPHVFRWMNASEMVASNIMKAPKGSDIMERCHAWASSHVGPDSEDWLAPTRFLHGHVQAAGIAPVAESVLGGETMRLDWMLSDALVPATLRAIHWCSENMRVRRFDKRGHPGTTYHRILSSHAT